MNSEKKDKTLPTLEVSVSPHIRDDETVKRIMWSVVASLIPAGIWSIFLFGLKAALVIVTSIIAACLTEAIILHLRRRRVDLSDGSAILTGLLLGFGLPPDVPLWLPVIGAVVAIGVGKQIFGGLGHNIFNPALVGRVFLLIAWSKEMTTWSAPLRTFLSGSGGEATVSSATPLAVISRVGSLPLPDVAAAPGWYGRSYLDLFLGNHAGSLGETSCLLLLVGALYLLIRGYISWRIPLSFIATAAFLAWLGGGAQIFSGDWLFHILSGGLFLGAFFMATDYVTSPMTGRGKIIFGCGCGAITFIIRRYGGLPEGVSFSILLMNAATPLIDRYCRPKRFGAQK